MQPGILKPNDDPAMQPMVAENRGPAAMRFTSVLELARPDLFEHEDSREIIVFPGKRAIIPHDYFKREVMGSGNATVIYHVGNQAPELRGYSRAYRLRVLARPWYKKFSDLISRD